MRTLRFENLRRAPLVAIAIVIALCAITIRSLAHAAESDHAAVTIFHADSLNAYVAAIAKVYKAAHPGAQVQTESSGSLDAIRKITDLHLPCDILITADWRLLQTPRAGIDKWAALFAGNSMGIVYTAHSKFASEINAANWREVLARPGVRYGHSNPERDPAGYWTLVVWQLAARLYHEPKLPEQLAAGCPRANIRPHNIDLIALLQSGELDYYFGYASDARLGDLKFLELPPQINLSDIKLASDYAKASIEVGSGPNRKSYHGLSGRVRGDADDESPQSRRCARFHAPDAGGRGPQSGAGRGTYRVSVRTRVESLAPDAAGGAIDDEAA